MNFGMSSLLPLKTKTKVINEPAWLNGKLEKMIRLRQNALSIGDMETFRRLRNQVNLARKALRAKYCKSKVEHLKGCDVSTWWKEIKNLSGMSLVNHEDTVSIVQQIECNLENSSLTNIANVINDAFLAPMCDFSPLPPNTCLATHDEAPFTVTEESVFQKL